MSDDNADVCEQPNCVEEATQYEWFNDEHAQLCEECFESLPIDGWTEERVLEIVNEITRPNGEVVSVGERTNRDEVVTCEWSGEVCFVEDAINIGNGDYHVHFSQEDDVSYCEDCSCAYHSEETTYHYGHEVTYCNECIQEHPEGGSDRWSSRFRWLRDDSLAKYVDKYTVTNGVGIEFEAEGQESISDNEELCSMIAEAKEDQSVPDGTEYTTHILQGDEIESVVRGMCNELYEKGFKLGDRVGWHFHYSMKGKNALQQKRVWRAFEQFNNSILCNRGIDDYKYFLNMTRQFAESWKTGYKEYASTWAKGKEESIYSAFSGWASNHSSTIREEKYAFANWNYMKGHSVNYTQDKDRIEIRLYYPKAVRELLGSTRWNKETYELLANDYLGFIRFWHELIDKSASGYMFKFADESYDTLPMEAFAEQFSNDTREWLLTTRELVRKQQERR